MCPPAVFYTSEFSLILNTVVVITYHSQTVLQPELRASAGRGQVRDLFMLTPALPKYKDRKVSASIVQISPPLSDYCDNGRGSYLIRRGVSAAVGKGVNNVGWKRLCTIQPAPASYNSFNQLAPVLPMVTLRCLLQPASSPHRLCLMPHWRFVPQTAPQPQVKILLKRPCQSCA